MSWVWDFIKKYFSNHHLVMWRPDTTYNFVQNTTPPNHAEKLLAVHITFDLREGSDSSRKLLLMNLNKAWNQKKLRETRADEKTLNTYLEIKIKIQLDELAERYDIRVSNVLEKLISQHYRELFQEKWFCFCAVRQGS